VKNRVPRVCPFHQVKNWVQNCFIAEVAEGVREVARNMAAAGGEVQPSESRKPATDSWESVDESGSRKISRIQAISAFCRPMERPSQSNL